MDLFGTFLSIAVKLISLLNKFWSFQPLSVTTNVAGLQTDDVDHVGQNSRAHVARVVGLQTDAVVVTEPRLKQASAESAHFCYVDWVKPLFLTKIQALNMQLMSNILLFNISFKSL